MSEIVGEKASTQEIIFFYSVEQYFEDLYQAFQSAQHSILIVGWDLHSKVDLCPQKVDLDPPSHLHKLFKSLLEKKPKLNIYLLAWEQSLFYFLERDPLLQWRFKYAGPKRIHYREDTTAPLGSSHHQKIVVIDGHIAYIGGCDVTACRWDDANHTSKNKFRVKPYSLIQYPPYHDTQIKISGEVAQEVIEIAKKRWNHATDHPLDLKLPSNLLPQKLSSEVGLRVPVEQYDTLETCPKEFGMEEVKCYEERLLKIIARATKTIYIENQFLTGDRLTQALGEKLQGPTPPEVIIVLPEFAGGQVEKEFMGQLQVEKVAYLKERDDQEKLFIAYPFHPLLKKDFMMIHSKVMIVDQREMVIGSANFNNRSMGLDTEVGLWFKGDLREVQLRLLSCTSGISYQELSNYEEQGEDWRHLLAKKKNLTGAEYYLKQFDNIRPRYFTPSSVANLTDMKEPPEEIKGRRIMEKKAMKQYKILQLFNKNVGTILLILFAFACAYFWKEFSHNHLLEQIRNYQQSHPYLVPAIILFLYFMSGPLFIPINIVFLLTGTIFSGFEAIIYALLGAQLSLLSSYLVGFLGLQFKRGKAGQNEKFLQHVLKNGSLLLFVLIRLIPTLPHSVLGMLAGNYKCPYGKYALGSALGLLPGSILIIVFQKNLMSLMEQPSTSNVLIALGVVMVLAIIFLKVRKRLGKFIPTKYENY